MIIIIFTYWFWLCFVDGDRLQNKSRLWSPSEDYFNTIVLGYNPDVISWWPFLMTKCGKFAIQWTTTSFDFHQMAVHKRTTMLAHCNLKQNMWLCSKQSCFFSFYALPSGGNLRGAVVHSKITTTTVRLICFRLVLKSSGECGQGVQGRCWFGDRNSKRLSPESTLWRAGEWPVWPDWAIFLEK